MPDRATDIARRLAEQVEVVCRHYLSSGRREGRYWLVGDADNTPGRSMFVRLESTEPAKLAGKWTDAATGEHGDLLDIIARRERRATLRETIDKARRFLALPRAEPADTYQHQLPAPTGSSEAARRLFAMSQPIAGTLAETYLRERGTTGVRTCAALRFHPRCWYRGDDDPADHVRDNWPALIAAVTDGAGIITGTHRIWLDISGSAKAPISTPRRAMGSLLGNGVRFGKVSDALAAGEGIETMLSLRCVLPTLPMIAALSANHLAALSLPNRLAGFISLATTIRPDGTRQRRSPNARIKPGSRRCRSCRHSATSTTICASWGCPLWQMGQAPDRPGGCRALSDLE